MRCSECDKVCFCFFLDWATEHVKSSYLNVCDLPKRISDKGVSKEPLMTFDNRPDTITERFDGCLTGGQVYRCYTAAVGPEYRRFNPPLSNKDKVMECGMERQREVKPSYPNANSTLRIGLNWK